MAALAGNTDLDRRTVPVSSLLKIFICPECSDVVKVPFNQCSNGHLVCNSCTNWGRPNVCPALNRGIIIGMNCQIDNVPVNASFKSGMEQRMIFAQQHVFWIKTRRDNGELVVSASVEPIGKLEGVYYARIKFVKGHFIHIGTVKVSVDGVRFQAADQGNELRVGRNALQQFPQGTPQSVSFYVELFTSN